MKDKIFVRGNILVNLTKFECQDFGCYMSEEYSKDAEIIENDLFVIDDDNKRSIFTTYYATGDVVFLNSEIKIWKGLFKYSFSRFHKEIENLNELRRIEITPELQKILYRQIFIGVIGAMEAYLQESLLSLIFTEEKYFKSFLNNYSPFRNEKISLSDIYKELTLIEYKVNEKICDINFHNIPKVKNVYEFTFGINFPDIRKINKYIVTRHDLVHRNGKDKEGNDVSPNNDDLNDLIKDISFFIKTINNLLLSKINL